MTRPRTGPVLTASDYQQLARDVVDPDVWDFIEGGAESERTLDGNVAAFDRVRLRPRVLTDVSTVDTAVSVFGADFATPLGVAPTAYHRLVDAEGEVATARGAGAAGALFVVSVFASRTLEDIAKASPGGLWLHLYWLNRRDVLADLIRRAADSGYQALLLTVDAPRIGRRWRDMRNGFAIGGDVAAVNIDAGRSWPRPTTATRATPRSPSTPPSRSTRPSPGRIWPGSGRRRACRSCSRAS